MKILIISNKEASYVKPLSDGLQKAFAKINIDATVLENGHLIFNKNNFKRYLLKGIKNSFKRLLATFLNKFHKIEQNEWITKKNINKFLEQLKDYDAIILTAHIPYNFVKSYYSLIEEIRKTYQIPIINYDLTYLPTRGDWYKTIKNTYKNDALGMKRYDWYLVASIVSENALIKEYQPFHFIGMDLKNSNLFPEQKTFRALLDFPQKGFEAERKIQKECLNELQIPFTELKTPLKIDEIRSLYRNTSIFFLSFRESFGLPIIELQLCGAKIATPYTNWAPSHYLKSDYSIEGEGNLGKNFIVYNNSKEVLKKQLIELKSSFNAEKNYFQFKNEYAKYYEIDKNVLLDFIEKLKTKEINSETHKKHIALNKLLNIKA